MIASPEPTKTTGSSIDGSFEEFWAWQGNGTSRRFGNFLGVS